MNLDLGTWSNVMLIHNSVVIYQRQLIKADCSVVRNLFAYLSVIRRILITNLTSSDYCIGFATKSIMEFNERCLFNAPCYQGGRSDAAVCFPSIARQLLSCILSSSLLIIKSGYCYCGGGFM